MTEQKSSPKLPSNQFVTVEVTKDDLRKKEPPLIDLKVTNPISYLKSWWKRTLGNEGIELKFKVKPLTAMAITFIVVTLSMGIGRIVLPFDIPFFEYTVIQTPSPTATPIPYRQTGFVGDLKYNRDTNKYYLITNTSEAISLSVPESINLSLLVGRRIFATGKYYPQAFSLVIDSVEDLEILPKKAEPIPTTSPSPSPIAD